MKRLVPLLLLVGCAVPETGISPPSDALYFPSGIAAHPAGRYLYITNAVFDRRFNQGTVVVYDTHTRSIVEDQTHEVGLFAGEVVFRGERELLTASRDDGRLYRFSVGDDGALSAAGDVSAEVSADPYGIAPGADGSVLVTHLSRGIVSHWTVDDDGAWQKGCSINLERGATGIARHPTLDWGFVTDRVGNRITMVEAVASTEFVRGETRTGGDRPTCELQTRGSILVDPSETQGRTRGLAFSEDGQLLFVASSSDDALRVYDTSVRTGGRPRNVLLRSIFIGDSPDGVRVAGRHVEGYAPAEEDTCDVGRMGQGLVYVTAFADDRVLVIDPRSLTVVARIDTGGGPHDVAFMCDAANRLRAYVTAFSDDAVSVIDIDPRSAERFRLVATVNP